MKPRDEVQGDGTDDECDSCQAELAKGLEDVLFHRGNHTVRGGGGEEWRPS